MTMKNSCTEATVQNQTSPTATCVKEEIPRGVRLEACEFERMLQRAMEVLRIRERMAA
jgi:hypothetical protein